MLSHFTPDNHQSTIVNHQPSIHQAPAKVNIRLKITGRRADGYHLLVSIMAPVGLYDRIELRPLSNGGITIWCEGFPSPADQKNLAYRAAESFFTHTGITPGLSIKLKKEIPVAAGLGGGSSDAACVLKALNQLWGYPLSQKTLAGLALDLGADVPFFLKGRPCIARGVGELLEPIEKWPKLWYVLVSPRLKISTAWVYESLNWPQVSEIRELELTRKEYRFIIDNLKRWPSSLVGILDNDLERVTASRFPAIGAAKTALADSGARGALMSGSGPTVFGIFDTETAAREAESYLTSLDMGDLFVAEGL